MSLTDRINKTKNQVDFYNRTPPEEESEHRTIMMNQIEIMTALLDIKNEISIKPGGNTY